MINFNLSAYEKLYSLKDNYDFLNLPLTEKVHHLIEKSAYAGNFPKYNHMKRVAFINKIFISQLNKILQNNVLDEELGFDCGFCHDIGHLLTPDNILLKNGKLDIEERNVVKGHSWNGYFLLLLIGENNKHILDTALYHQEYFNGKGYHNIKGENIPIIARITAIADWYDALRSKRSYKEALSQTEAIDIMEECMIKGVFDSELFNFFVKNVVKGIECLYE